MEDKIAKYIRKHTMTMFWLTVISFVILATGEYVLYRKVMAINKMVAESTMQLKEDLRPKYNVMMQKGKVMIERNGEYVPLESDMMTPDGTMMMKNGTIINPDGSHMQLQEGKVIELQ